MSTLGRRARKLLLRGAGNRDSPARHRSDPDAPQQSRGSTVGSNRIEDRAGPEIDELARALVDRSIQEGEGLVGRPEPDADQRLKVGIDERRRRLLAERGEDGARPIALPRERQRVCEMRRGFARHTGVLDRRLHRFDRGVMIPDRQVGIPEPVTGVREPAVEHERMPELCDRFVETPCVVMDVADRQSAVARVFLALLVIGCLSAPAQAEVRTIIPTEDPGPPFYVRVERQAVHTEIVPHTDDLAALVFYRSPTCVPPQFNLMDLFDPPAAFGCSLTIDGWQSWRNGPPPVDFAPALAHFYGLGAVPVWIVSWPELQSAVADDVLTLDEVRAMPSLRRGAASFYREVLHPTEGSDNTSLSIHARGVLDDGQTFQLHHEGSRDGIDTRIQIGLFPARPQKGMKDDMRCGPRPLP